jgi:hypothetical protein
VVGSVGYIRTVPQINIIKEYEIVRLGINARSTATQ